MYQEVSSNTRAVLALCSARPIAFHRYYLYLGINVSAALFLSQASYWSTNAATISRGGWFYKIADEWQLETGLTRREQEGARKKLKALGILEEKRKGIPAKLYFRLDTNTLHTLLLKIAREQGKLPEDETQTEKA